jgi:hypothetical protein
MERDAASVGARAGAALWGFQGIVAGEDHRLVCQVDVSGAPARVADAPSCAMTGTCTTCVPTPAFYLRDGPSLGNRHSGRLPIRQIKRVRLIADDRRLLRRVPAAGQPARPRTPALLPRSRPCRIRAAVRRGGRTSVRRPRPGSRPAQEQKPVEVLRQLAQICPPSGTVLDPSLTRARPASPRSPRAADSSVSRSPSTMPRSPANGYVRPPNDRIGRRHPGRRPHHWTTRRLRLVGIRGGLQGLGEPPIVTIIGGKPKGYLDGATRRRDVQCDSVQQRGDWESHRTVAPRRWNCMPPWQSLSSSALPTENEIGGAASTVLAVGLLRARVPVCCPVLETWLPWWVPLTGCPQGTQASWNQAPGQARIAQMIIVVFLLSHRFFLPFLPFMISSRGRSRRR